MTLISILFQVKQFSKRYHTLIDACDGNIVQCDRCLRHLADDDTACDCIEKTEVKRISGKWKLARISRTNQIKRMFFESDSGELLCSCQFTGKEEKLDLTEGEIYNISGWQNVNSRHNVIHIEV